MTEHDIAPSESLLLASQDGQMEVMPARQFVRPILQHINNVLRYTDHEFIRLNDGLSTGKLKVTEGAEFKGGKGSNKGTHFPASNGNNYISGDTVLREGDLAVEKGNSIRFGQVHLTEELLQSMLTPVYLERGQYVTREPLFPSSKNKYTRKWLGEQNMLHKGKRWYYVDKIRTGSYVVVTFDYSEKNFTGNKSVYGVNREVNSPGQVWSLRVYYPWEKIPP